MHTLVRRTNRRTELLTIRMTMQERGEIQDVAQAHGVAVAELVRAYVRAELAILKSAVEPKGARK